MIEVLKQAYQLLLTEPHAPTVCDQLEVVFRRAIAELESQEPDVVRLSNGTFDVIGSRVVPLGALLYLHPPQHTEQNFCPRCGKRTNDIHTCTPPQGIYYTPPQRTWVGLTDDDEIPWDGVDAKSFARAIEAKLKEKNT
jgi:hypothetical protein